MSLAWEWPGREQLESADLIVAFTGTQDRWNAERLRDLEKFLERGGGFVAAHSAVITGGELSRRLAGLIGLAWETGYTTYRHGPVELEIASPDHPICFGLPARIPFVDETYWPLVGDPGRVEVLATADERMPGGGEIKPQPMFWTYRRGKGRVFGCILGHYTWTFDDPYCRILLLRGMAWAAGESPFRFDSLVLRGSRVRGGTRRKGPEAQGHVGAIESLPGWQRGKSRVALTPIDDALAASHGDAKEQRELEERLLKALESAGTRDAKDFVCRRLSRIGSAASAPALGALLEDRDLSHMARYALERIDAPEALAALRGALPRVAGKTKAGVICSLGRLGDRASAPLLIPLFDRGDPEVSSAAAVALGRIGAPQAIAPLKRYREKDQEGALFAVACEASLELAHRLVERGSKEDAAGVFSSLESVGPASIRAAALQGLVRASPREAVSRLAAALGGDDPRLRRVATRVLETSDRAYAQKVRAELKRIRAAARR